MKGNGELISCGVVAGEFQTEGPIQAEVFLVWTDGSVINVTGPCGPEPWYIEVTAGDDPTEVVSGIVKREVANPIVVHSTSWRHGTDSVLLSFIVVIGAGDAAGLLSKPVERAELARGSATDAPADIGDSQVLEHGLRHLAWLLQDDDAVSESLGEEWLQLLEEYVPEPFQNLR